MADKKDDKNEVLNAAKKIIEQENIEVGLDAIAVVLNKFNKACMRRGFNSVQALELTKTYLHSLITKER